MAITIRNFMPHKATILLPDGEVKSFPSEGIARVAVTEGALEVVDGLPIKGADVFGEIEGLPEPEEGVLFLVSGICAAHKGSRTDLLVPGTGPGDDPVRFPEGHKLEGKVQMVRLFKRA